MVTSDQRKADFMADLQAVLDKHFAELQVTDDGAGYGMHNGVCRVTMASLYSGHELVRDFVEFELPSFMWPRLSAADQQ